MTKYPFASAILVIALGARADPTAPPSADAGTTPSDAARRPLVLSVDPADPHALVPSDPHASLVQTTDGGLAVIFDAPADRALAQGGATVPGQPGTGTLVVEHPETGTTVVKPGAGQTVLVQPGEERRASFGVGPQPTTRAPEQMRDRQAAIRDRRGPYLNSILIAPRAFADVDRLSGLRRDDVGGALGLQLDRVLASPLSLVLGADLGTRDRGPGLSDATMVGVNAGLNLYLLGGDNRGLYVGPRASFAATGYDARLGDTGDRLGYGGEAGLRLVTSGGFTAGLAAGVMRQTRGALAFDRAQLAADPAARRTYGYGALQLGWSF